MSGVTGRKRLVDLPDESREVTDRQVLHRGAVFDFVTESVRLADGADPVVREYVDHPGAVAVVALRGEAGAEELAMVRQYRHPVRARLWELPAGLRDVDGEEPVETARRELREETDLEAGRWHVLADIVNSAGCSSEGLRIFLARDITELDEAFERADEESEFETTWVRLDDAVAAVLAGDVHSSTTAVGVLAAATARGDGWAPLRPADARWTVQGRHPLP